MTVEFALNYMSSNEKNLIAPQSQLRSSVTKAPQDSHTYVLELSPSVRMMVKIMQQSGQTTTVVCTRTNSKSSVFTVN